MVGQKIGSRVMVAIPPARLGAAGQRQAGIGAHRHRSSSSSTWSRDVNAAEDRHRRRGPAQGRLPDRQGRIGTNGKAARSTVPKIAAPTTLVVQHADQGRGSRPSRPARPSWCTTRACCGRTARSSTRPVTAASRGHSPSVPAGRHGLGQGPGRARRSAAASCWSCRRPTGTAPGAAEIGAKDTMVFVVDILAGPD